jgi:glycosyltransferase involved in cell wall biosynthesis
VSDVVKYPARSTPLLPQGSVPVTVLVAVRNERPNIERCIAALRPAARVVVVDSGSRDGTPEMARDMGAEVVQFVYTGGYPKKRQWALEQLAIATEWVMCVDADEVVPGQLWVEIDRAVRGNTACDAYTIAKQFHFLGRRFRFGGFSFRAVVLFRLGHARFERLVDDGPDGLDMEVHERVLVDGQVGSLPTPLVHDDFKGLAAYLERHNRYSTWEAKLRDQYFRTGRWGLEGVAARPLGNTQERRRFLKMIAIRVPFEALAWFAYHYIVRLGFLEGRRGLIAAQIRAGYIQQIRTKLFELRLGERARGEGRGDRAGEAS